MVCSNRKLAGSVALTQEISDREWLLKKSHHYHQFPSGQAVAPLLSFTDAIWQVEIDDATVARIFASSASRSGVVCKVRITFFRAESYTFISAIWILLPDISERQVNVGCSNNFASGDSNGFMQNWRANSSEDCGGAISPS